MHRTERTRGLRRVLRPGALVCLVLLVLAPQPSRGGVTRRFALLVGDNHGGAGTIPLYYAHDDARRIHDILVRLGGVKPGDARLLFDADKSDFLEALAALDARIARARARGDRTVLLVYYSGHAKDGALRLGNTALPLDELRKLLAAAPADVRIGILDSCRSGMIDRAKGARRAPAFDVDTGSQTQARGMVLLTSSSANEDSQESDRIGGSFFTYNLASGLLGDADRSGDGRVTLSEAYAYAYDHTVAETASTAAGPQHPTFAYDLAGNGDVVLTDVGRRHEGLLLPAAAPAGTYFLVNGSGRVSAEVDKSANVARHIALAPGDYKVERRLSDHLRIGDVTIPGGRTVTLDEGTLHDAPFADDPVKGAGTRFGPPETTAWGVALLYQSFFAAGGLFPSAPILSVETRLPGVFGRDWRLGLDVDVGGSHGTLTVDGLQPLTYAYSEIGVGAAVDRVFDLGVIQPYLGARVGFVFLHRAFDASTGLPAQYFSTFTPGLVGGLGLRLGAGFQLAIEGRLDYLYYNVDGDRSLGDFSLGGMVVYEP